MFVWPPSVISKCLRKENSSGRLGGSPKSGMESSELSRAQAWESFKGGIHRGKMDGIEASASYQALKLTCSEVVL